jgi:hypothetical protein
MIFRILKRVLTSIVYMLCFKRRRDSRHGDYEMLVCVICDELRTLEYRVLVRCVTEHEYGERGSAGETERWEGRRREDGERGSTGDREMGGKIAWLYTLQPKLFPRTEKQIGEERSREAKEEIIAVFTVYRGFKRCAA